MNTYAALNAVEGQSHALRTELTQVEEALSVLEARRRRLRALLDKADLSAAPVIPAKAIPVVSEEPAPPPVVATQDVRRVSLCVCVKE